MTRMNEFHYLLESKTKFRFNIFSSTKLLRNSIKGLAWRRNEKCLKTTTLLKSKKCVISRKLKCELEIVFKIFLLLERYFPLGDESRTLQSWVSASRLIKSEEHFHPLNPQSESHISKRFSYFFLWAIENWTKWGSRKYIWKINA